MPDLNWGEKLVDYENVTVDSELQVRVSLSEDRITDFVDIYDQLPPVRIVKVGNDFLLADGFHRYNAAERRRVPQIKALIADGTYRDALMVAIESNVKGPLPLTRDDKRKAISKVLKFSPEMANSWIAEEVGSSMQTVESVRKVLEDAGEIQTLEEFQRRDGKVTPRKYSPVEEKDDSDDELRDIARIASAQTSVKPGVTRVADEIRDTVLGDISLPVEKPSVEKTVETERIEFGFDIILQESVDLPIGIYRLLFSKDGDEMEIRLHSIDQDGTSPTTVGLKGSSSEMSKKMLTFSML